MRANDIEGRVVRWFSDERNTIVLLYFLAIGLGLTSIVLFFLGGEGDVGRLELGLLVAAGAIIFYMVIVSLANRPD